ncbi:hypothetical protein ABTE44_19495, partial [Acinetobacter baumannii]
NAPYVPGVLNIKVSMGQSMFTNADVTEFRSEIPLVVKHKGASDIMSFEEGRDGVNYTLKITLLRPTFRIVAEAAADITEDTLPRV